MQQQQQQQQQQPQHNAESRHRCHLCHRTYERHDHLSRHIKSHSNQRPHKCTECGKGFNRADLLNRHRAAHIKTANGHDFRKRTPRACETCIKAKTKCDNQRPCNRCKTRQLDCQDADGRDRPSTAPPQDTSSQLATPASPPRQAEDAALFQNDLPLDMTALDMRQDLFTDQLPLTDITYPNFFEQIMTSDMPNLPSNDQAVMPLDVSGFTQDFNWDTLDFDFSFFASGLTRPPSAQGFHQDHQALQTDQAPHTEELDAHVRSETFKRAPWSWHSWIPDRNHSTFTGQEEINIREDRVSASYQQVSPTAKRYIHCELEQEARDRMIRAVTQTASSRLAMPSFPSLELLEDLIDVFLLQDSYSITSLIHAPTFDGRSSLTELLLSIVAFGSRYIALTPVWKMGLVLHEVSRLAVVEVFESDNSNTRRLQPLQAYMLIVSMGVWSGFRRKTEMACSFLQIATTILNWSNSFTKFRYQDIVPLEEDTDDVLETKWKTWLEQEGRKRLVCFVLVHDSQTALGHMQSPIVTPAYLMLPLPASTDLWLAPNAHAWRNLYLVKQPPSQNALPSMLEVFGDLNILDTLTGLVDQELCVLVACHAIAHELWQFRQHAHMLSHWTSQTRKDRWLTHLNRQRELFDALTTISAYCEMHSHLSPEISFTVEFLLMALHVSLEDIQVFSGKHGEDEARKVYPRIRSWTQDAEARTCVWHAGQVIRIARTFEKTRLRDFYAVALYETVLTLWVYGMVTSSNARRSGDKTPTNPESMRVFLDDGEEKVVKSFKLLGQGTPGLKAFAWSGDSTRNDFCPLHNSRGLMAIAEETLKQNFPESRDALPPLVENLANLLHDLGRLSAK